jgi:hypothetical protein
MSAISRDEKIPFIMGHGARRATGLSAPSPPIRTIQTRPDKHRSNRGAFRYYPLPATASYRYASLSLRNSLATQRPQEVANLSKVVNLCADKGLSFLEAISQSNILSGFCFAFRVPPSGARGSTSPSTSPSPCSPSH